MDASDLEEVLLLNDEVCQASITAFRRDLQRMRTGRASTSLLEGITVDYYGSKTALTHLGQVSSPEPRLIVVQVYDTGAVETVEKAIRSSDLGFNPSREGNTLRINVPVLTEESRRDIVKVLHKNAEDIRISIRNHRRVANDAIKKFEKDGEIAKDDAKRGLEKIQKQIDGYIAEVDKILESKEAEVMEV